jgi:hypothetical protein
VQDLAVCRNLENGVFVDTEQFKHRTINNQRQTVAVLAEFSVACLSPPKL